MYLSSRSLSFRCDLCFVCVGTLSPIHMQRCALWHSLVARSHRPLSLTLSAGFPFSVSAIMYLVFVTRLLCICWLNSLKCLTFHTVAGDLQHSCFDFRLDFVKGLISEYPLDAPKSHVEYLLDFKALWVFVAGTPEPWLRQYRKISTNVKFDRFELEEGGGGGGTDVQAFVANLVAGVAVYCRFKACSPFCLTCSTARPTHKMLSFGRSHKTLQFFVGFFVFTMYFFYPPFQPESFGLNETKWASNQVVLKESPPQHPNSPTARHSRQALLFVVFSFRFFFCNHFFFDMFLVVYSKFHTWCMEASGKYPACLLPPASTPSPPWKPARRRRHKTLPLQVSRLIDFLISSSSKKI